MSGRRLVVFLFAASLLSFSGGRVVAGPNDFVGTEQYFRVEWQQSTGKRGPVVSGYVHNKYGNGAADVQLLVEGLDAGGNVVSTTRARVLGVVPALGSSFFETPVPGGAASYRVRVVFFNFVGRGA